MTEQVRIDEKNGTITLSLDMYNELMAHTSVFVPVMTLERFSDLTGLTDRGRESAKGKYGVVEGLRRNGYLPTVKLGRHVMVYLPDLQERLAKQISF
jgi:hypothetical protein